MPDPTAAVLRRVVLLAAALLGAALTIAVVSGIAVPGDDLLLGAAHTYLLHRPTQVRFWTAVTNAGGPVTWEVLAAAVVVHQAVRRRWRSALLVTVAMSGSVLLSTTLKIVIGRARPDFAQPLAHAYGYSFPSGHAQTSGVALGLVVLAAARAVGRVRVRCAVYAVAAVLAAAIGVSRVLLGVHYPSDVMAGWIFAFCWLQILITLPVFRSVWTDRQDATVRHESASLR